MAEIIRADGTRGAIVPARAGRFSLREIYYLIGCRDVHIVFLADGRRMIARNDFSRDAINEFATVLFQEGRSTGTAIRGTALVGTRDEIR